MSVLSKVLSPDKFMSTNLEYRARERQRKKKVGGRPARLNEKKGDRDLEQEIKNKGDIF